MFRQAYAHLLAQLTEMPRFVERAAMSVPRALLLRQPERDKSPLLEHLWHLRDCDSDLYAMRIRRVLRESRPTLEPVDVGSWPVARDYLHRDGDQAITEFVGLRAALVAELEPLDEEALSRVGQRPDGSTVNVLRLIEQLAEHDQDHRWRIAAIFRSFTSPS